MDTHRQLILVKHSLPAIVENVPAREWNLSSEGKIRARRLAEELELYQPEIILTSVEPKARQTAEILAEHFHLEFAAVNCLHEHDRSGIPFYSTDEFQSHVRELFAKPNTLVFGNETGLQALERFRKTIESILESYKSKNVIIVSHGTVISLFISWLTGIDGYLLWKELGLPSFVALDMQSKTLLKTENID